MRQSSTLILFAAVALALPATLPGPDAVQTAVGTSGGAVLCGEGGPVAGAGEAYEEPSTDEGAEEFWVPLGLTVPRRTPSLLPLWALGGGALPEHSPSVFRPPDLP